jgi:hypothetical protein
MSGFTNDPFGYLPGAIRGSQFIREGHNTYSKASGGVVHGRYGKKSVARSIDSLKAKTAKRLIRKGGEVGAEVAKERPVLAAKVAARQRTREASKSGEKGAMKQARELNRASVKTARSSVDSARHERKARKEKA